MTEEYRAAEHHGSAVVRHQQAMRFHREAALHYQRGQDYALAAHMALVAHGHGWQAIEHGRQANTYYIEQESPPAPTETAPGSPSGSLNATGTELTTPDCQAHHAAAADHHAHAARHHGAASKHGDEKNYSLAAREAQIAHSHALQATFHSNEAASHHAEHYGKSRPTAELT